MGTTYESNVDEVYDWQRQAFEEFSLAEHGTGQAMVECVAAGIQDRSYFRQQGATEDWPENEYGYKQWKKKFYNADKTNYRTGQMLSTESLLASVTIDARSIEIAYGTGLAPTTSDSGYLERSDTDVTDIEKAYYAAALGRPFFELDDSIKDHTFEIFVQAYAQHLRNR